MKDRDKVVEALQRIGLKLAEEYGYDTMTVGEDRQKGLWGEFATDYLESKYGSCTEEIIWSKDKENYVEFRFRFANPVLTIEQYPGILASIEISDYDDITKSHGGIFDISNIQAWKREGLKLVDKLVQEWYEEDVVARILESMHSEEPDTNDPSQFPACLDDVSDYGC